MLKTVGFPSTRTGDQTIINGNLVIGTAGKGIDFSADSNAPGMTSELLDDYEEGAWTPDLQFGGAATGITYVVRQATYTRIGRQVFVQVGMYLSNKGSATGDATIAGLPFTVSNAAFKNENGIVGGTGSLTVVGVPYAVADANSTVIKLNVMNNGATSAMTNVAFANNTYFGFCLTYTV